MPYGCLNSSEYSVSVMHFCMKSIGSPSSQPTRLNKKADLLWNVLSREPYIISTAKLSQINPRAVVCNMDDKEVQNHSCCDC